MVNTTIPNAYLTLPSGKTGTREGEPDHRIMVTGTLSQLPERQFFDAGSGSEAGYLSDFSKKSDVNIHWNRTTRSTMKAPRPLYIKRFQRLTNINKT